ncbi:unnamed protein product [Closterium sp. NIES-54]
MQMIASHNTGDPRAAGAGAGDTGAGGAGTGEVGAGDTGTVDLGAGGAGAGGAVCGGTGAEGTGRPRPFFVPLFQQVLGLPSSTSFTSPLLWPPPDLSQPPLQLASPLPAACPYTEQTGGPTARQAVVQLDAPLEATPPRDGASDGGSVAKPPWFHYIELYNCDIALADPYAVDGGSKFNVNVSAGMEVPTSTQPKTSTPTFTGNSFFKN